MASDNTIRIAFEQLAEPESPKPMQTQEAPKAPETRPAMMAPTIPQAPEQPVLSPVQDAIVAQQARAQAMETEISTLKQEEAAQAEIPFGEQIKMGVEPQFRQFPEELAGTNVVGKTISDVGDTSLRVALGTTEKSAKSFANIGLATAESIGLGGFIDQLNIGRDENGQPLRRINVNSYKAKDFAIPTRTETEEVVSNILNELFIAYVLGAGMNVASKVQGADLTSRLIRGVGKVGAVDNKTTFAGKLGARFFNNGLENLLTYAATDQALGVQDLIRMAGLEDDVPEVLTRNGKVSTLQEKAVKSLSVALAGGVVGGTLETMLGGLAKIILGRIGQQADDVIDDFLAKNKGPDGKPQLATVGIASENYDSMIESGFDDVMNSIDEMNAAPPTGGGGGAPPAPPAPPVPPVPPGGGRPPMSVDEARALLRGALDTPQPGAAEGPLTALEARTEALRKQAGPSVRGAGKFEQVNSVSRELDRVIERATVGNPQGLLRLKEAALIVFRDELGKIMRDMGETLQKEGKGSAARALSTILAEVDTPAFIVNSADDAVFGQMAVKALNDTFGDALNALKPDDLAAMTEATRALYLTYTQAGAAGVNPADALARMVGRAMGDDVVAPLTPAQMLVNMTLTKDTLTKIADSLYGVDISALTDAEVARHGNAIFQALQSLHILKRMNAGKMPSGEFPPSVVSQRAKMRGDFFIEGGEINIPKVRNALAELTRAQTPTANPGPPRVREALKQLESPTGGVTIRPPEQATIEAGRPTTVTEAGTGTLNLENLDGDTVRGLAQLLAQNATLAETVLRLGRAGIFNNQDLARIKTLIDGSYDNQELTMFLAQLFNNEQRAALERIQTLNEVFNSRNVTSNPISNVGAGFTNGGEPLAPKIPSLVRETDKLADTPLVAERLGQLEVELIKQAKQAGERTGAAIPTDKEDLLELTGVTSSRVPWLRLLERFNAAGQKGLLFDSAITVLWANVATTLVDGLGAATRGLGRFIAKDDLVGQLSWYRAKETFKIKIIMAGAKSGTLARDAKNVLGSPVVTGRSRLLRDSTQASERLSRLRTGRALAEAKEAVVLPEDPVTGTPLKPGGFKYRAEEIASGGRIGAEIVTDLGHRGIATVDELFKQSIYAVEYKVARIEQIINKSQGTISFEQAVAKAEAEWNAIVDKTIMRTESELLKEAAAKVSGVFNKSEDPFSFAAAVELEYRKMLGEMGDTMDPNSTAPRFLTMANDQIKQHLRYVSGSLDLQDTKPGMLVQAAQSDNPIFRGVAKLGLVFPATVVNEILRIADLGLNAPIQMIKIGARAAGADTLRPIINAAGDASDWESKTSRWAFNTTRELYHPDAAVRSRAEGRVAFATFLVTLGIITSSRGEGKPETVQEAVPGLDVQTDPTTGKPVSVTKPFIGVAPTTASPTVNKAVRDLGIKPGSIGGINIPVISPVIATGQKIGDVLSAVLYWIQEAKDAALEDDQSGYLTAGERLQESILNVAEATGGTDFAEQIVDAYTKPQNTAAEAGLRMLAVPAGGQSLWSKIAEFSSDYRYGSRGMAPVTYNPKTTVNGTPLELPQWLSVVSKVLGNRGPVKRDKNGIPVESDWTDDLFKILYRTDRTVKLNLGKDRRGVDANNTMFAVLAANGYITNPLMKDLTDPVSSRGAPGTVNLKEYRLADGRTAYEHLADYFVFGTKDIAGSDIRKQNPPGMIGGPNNRTLIEYLEKKVDITGLKAINLRANKTDPEYAKAKQFLKELNAAISERQAAALDLLLDQSDLEASQGKGRSLRKDFVDIAGGTR